jgi:hypothetical protein
MTEKTSDLETEIDKLIDEYYIFELNNNAPSTLYHYSNLSALKGIIESKKLWATHIKFLNDKNEIKYAFEEITIPIIKGFSQNKNLKLLEYFERLEKGFETTDSLDFYITSFSEKRDCLSQWRSYGNGYASVCIGFNSEKFILNKSEIILLLNKMVYDKEKQRDSIRSFLSDVCDIQSKYPDEKISEEQYREFFNILFRLSAQIKHPSWEEESEWRLTYLLGRHEEIKPELRIGRASLIPYISNNPFEQGVFEKCGISEILLPESDNFENSKMAIEKLLDINGFEKVRITKSEIPIAY